MKKKLLIVGWVLLFSLLTVGIALGFSASNVDGVWGHIDCSTTSLYFSEYVYDQRGGTDIVALEIYNGSSAAVDLSAYSIRLYYSATTNTYNTKSLTGTLAVGDTWVLVNAEYAGSVTWDDDSFLDNDDYRTIVLYNGTTIVDVIGNVATPNTTEPSNNLDTTLRRNITVCLGDPIGGTPNFNTSQWTRTAVVVYTNLGTYAGYEGATCDNYATGGDRTLGGAVTTVQASWWDQTPLDTDWNQVRYGNVGGTCASTPAFFATQSGMGFDGEDDIPSVTGFNEPFLLGQFCHYNNPINSPANAFDNINLDITITSIQCEAPILIEGPATPPDVTFNYNFVLDETPNTAPCAYTTVPAGPVCADAIFIAQDASPAYFTCKAPGTPPVEVEFTVAIMGFNPLDDQGECPAEYDPTQSTGAFISNEGTSNCACFYGVFTDYVPTSVDLLSFTGTRLADGILLEWQTADEIDNLGFNLYRATSESGTKVKLNVDLIPTNMMPGSLVGGSYSFEDLTATTNETYFYWLEDVDASGTTTMHGPVEVP